MTNEDVIGLIPDLLQILKDDSDDFLNHGCSFSPDDKPIFSMLPRYMHNPIDEDQDTLPNDSGEDSEDDSMRSDEADGKHFDHDLDFMDIQFDSDDESEDEESDIFIMQIIVNHIFNDANKLTMTPTARYFDAARTILKIMCEFDEDVRILQAKEVNKTSKTPPLPPLTKPEDVPTTTNQLGKYLVVANNKALHLNQKDLNGVTKEQDPLYISSRVSTSYNRKSLIDGIKEDCEAEKIVPLVKKCQSIYSSSLFLLFNIHFDLCNLGVQKVLTAIFDNCLKAQAHRTGLPQKTVEFVIKKAEIRMPSQVEKQPEFRRYASGDYDDLLYAKQLTCPMKLTKPIKQLIGN